MQTFFLMNNTRTIKNAIKKQEDLVSFYWEIQEKEDKAPPEILTEEQWLELDKKVAKIEAKARPV